MMQEGENFRVYQPDEILFLLGGYDLEMMEIVRLLQNHGYDFVDKQLTWENATWDAYHAYFDDPRVLAGIELMNKTAKPPHAIDIDHHNERHAELSAIEQVAQLTGVRLNRWQQLVAANDRGYIPAMQAMGATPEEIERIRSACRRAQGVSQEDEKLARYSLQHQTQWQGSIAIVHAATPRFSPITDRLFGHCKAAIVYHDGQLCLYWFDIDTLIEKLKDWIDAGSAFYGGGRQGYFCLKIPGKTAGEIEKSVLPEINKRLQL